MSPGYDQGAIPAPVVLSFLAIFTEEHRHEWKDSTASIAGIAAEIVA
jgi:hypothetical protein